jgi:hypothetical protein
MLMQFAMKPARTMVAKFKEKDKDEDADGEDEDKSAKKPKAASSPSDDEAPSGIKAVLSKALENSNRSGEPFDYALDVDYIHDADNPLDNGGKANDLDASKSDDSDSDSSKDDSDSKSSKADNDDSDSKSSKSDKDASDSKSSDGSNQTSKDGGKGGGKGKGDGKGKGKGKGKADSNMSKEDYGTQGGKALLVPGCSTRFDSRAVSSFATTVSTAGSYCIFGVDDRDEGSHCILSDGSYGTNGWCWTAEDRTTWGSCNEFCPLWGPAGVLEKRIDKMNVAVDKLLTKIKKKKDCGDSKGKSMLEISEQNAQEEDAMSRLGEESLRNPGQDA